MGVTIRCVQRPARTVRFQEHWSFKPGGAKIRKIPGRDVDGAPTEAAPGSCERHWEESAMIPTIYRDLAEFGLPFITPDDPGMPVAGERSCRYDAD